MQIPNYTFEFKRKKYHSAPQFKGETYLAFSSKYAVFAHKLNHTVFFSVHLSEDVTLGTLIFNAKTVYAFRYHLSEKVFYGHSDDRFPNSLRMNSYDQAWFQKDIISSFEDSLAKDLSGEITSLDLTNSVPAKQNPTHLSPSRERVKLVTDIAHMKELILRSVHYLNEEQRKTYLTLWDDYEAYIEMNEDWIQEIQEPSQLVGATQLEFYYLDFKNLYEEAVLAKNNGQGIKKLAILFAEVQQVAAEIRQHPKGNDLFIEHQCTTILSDCTKLMDEYHATLPENRRRLDHLVMEGLNEGLRKLGAATTLLEEKEERTIERQVWLIRER